MDRNILSQKSHFLSALFLSFFIAEHVAQRNISIVCYFIVWFHTRARMVRETSKGPELSPVNFGSHFSNYKVPT